MGCFRDCCGLKCLISQQLSKKTEMPVAVFTCFFCFFLIVGANENDKNSCDFICIIH